MKTIPKTELLDALALTGREIRYYYLDGSVALFSDDGRWQAVAMTDFLDLRSAGVIRHTGRRDGQWTDRGQFCDVYKLAAKDAEVRS